MSHKSKGTNAERELFHLFWSQQWAVVRAAGSGSTKMPCPDLIVGNVNRTLAIECKVTKSIKQYLTKTEIEELKKFSTQFGAEPWIAIKFNKTRNSELLPWYFLTPEDLEETEGNNYVVSIPLAKRRGLGFEELIR